MENEHRTRTETCTRSIASTSILIRTSQVRNKEEERKTNEGRSNESDIKGFVSVLGETLNPRKPGKRSNTREDRVGGN